MIFLSRLLSGAILFATGMVLYRVQNLAKHNDGNTQDIHNNKVCELCGIIDNIYIFHGIRIVDKGMIYDSNQSVILCNSCRNQTDNSKAWYSLQKKEI